MNAQVMSLVALGAGFVVGIVLDEFFGRRARTELKAIETRLAALEQTLRKAAAKL